EVVVVAVAIEELDRPLLHRGTWPLRSGLERALHGLAALDVPEGDPDLGRAAAHLDVVVVEDLPGLTVELDGGPLLQFAGADHSGWAPGRAPAGPCRARGRRRSRFVVRRPIVADALAASDRQNESLARELCQPIHPTSGSVDQEEILDPDASLPFEVDP